MKPIKTIGAKISKKEFQFIFFKLLAFSYFLMNHFYTYAQDYIITKIEGGKVTYNSKTLKPESIIKPNYKVFAYSENIKMAMIEANQGKDYLIQLKKGLNVLAKEVIVVTKYSGTRNGAINNLVDLRIALSGDSLLILDNELKLLVNIPQYPMNEKQFFYISFTYNNEQIPKKLNFSGDKLIISKSELFKVDGKSVEGNLLRDFKFFYRNQITNESTEICNLYPVFIETSQIIEEIQIIKKHYNSDNQYKTSLTQQVSCYLTARYGTPEKNNLAMWLEKYLNVK